MSLNRFMAVEASIKYFVLSNVSLGFFFFSIILSSLMFGTTKIVELVSLCLTNDLIGFIIFSTLILYLFYKLAVFPMMWWAPDVYQGANIIGFFILTVFSKFAIIGIFLKLLSNNTLTVSILVFFIWSSVGSLFFGALGALHQNNIKRFFAFTGMHHIGFIILIVAVFTYKFSIAIMFYLIVYIFALIIWFLFYSIVVDKIGSSLIFLCNFKQIGFHSSAIPITLLIISICSMAGFPPFVGFITKYWIFSGLVITNGYLTTLTLVPNVLVFFFVTVITSVISAYNYLRILGLIIFNSSKITFKSLLFNTFDIMKYVKIINCKSKCIKNKITTLCIHLFSSIWSHFIVEHGLIKLCTIISLLGLTLNLILFSDVLVILGLYNIVN